MKPVEILIIVPTLLWLLVTLAAVISLIWAAVDSARRQAVSVVALCLWSTLAGGTLMSCLWATISAENMSYHRRQIAGMPRASKVADVKL